jgi:prephenate dehydrogenase
MTIQITILGLNQIGASIGLALGSLKDQVRRVGNDREPAVSRQAEKMGAVDKTMVNLPSAVRDADVVILAMPVDEIYETIEVIAQDLKPGAVLIDTSPVKTAAVEWAKNLLPAEDRYFISMTPSFNPAHLMQIGNSVEHARADLFTKGVMVITSPPGTDESALTLASNLTAALGATPLFADPAEAEGLLAYSRLLPELLAAALVHATTGQPGWREARKLAGPNYAIATYALTCLEESKDLGQSAILNSANLVRMLDQVTEEIQHLRDALHNQDAEALRASLESAQKARVAWLDQRAQAEWEVKSTQNVHLPSGGEVIGRLFGWRPRKDKDKNQRR